MSMLYPRPYYVTIERVKDITNNENFLKKAGRLNSKVCNSLFL